MQQGTELRVQLEVAGVDRNHPLTEQAYEEFTEDVDSLVGVTVEERAVPAVGQKGWLTDLALVPGTPSAAWAVFRLIKLWLERDQKRSVEVTVVRPGVDPYIVRASGEKVSLDLLEQSVKAAVQGEAGMSPEAGADEGQSDPAA